jgi:GNAT superfamily N-acetyltransferase
LDGITVRAFGPKDREWANGLLTELQGEPRTARLGELIDPLGLPGFVAEKDGESIALLTYIIKGDKFEIFTLHGRVENVGAGSALMKAAEGLAREKGCQRVWLCTTNDNVNALGFCQRRGLVLRRLHAEAVNRDRLLKPTISLVNRENGIPIRDLLELEKQVSR